MHDFSAEARLYLRPVDFVDAPQLTARRTERLAGGMIWFAGVELWGMEVGAPRPKRVHISLEDWEEAHEALAGWQAERARALFANLTAPRTPLTLGQRTIRFDAPHVMGIVNMTPDSFSDGGKHKDVEAATVAAHDMAAAGASIVDIGGESTRPGAALVWEGDEAARIVPLVERLVGAGAVLSIDTRKAAVMEAALAKGAHIINDISGLAYDERALEVVAAAGAPVCIMHASSQSSDPHKDANYLNVVTDVFDWLEARIGVLESAGIARTNIIVDLGFGFGKSLAQNLTLLNALSMFHALGCPLLVGVSRKRMIAALSGEADSADRMGGSLLLAGKAFDEGAQILRVHDVTETVQALRVWRGLRDAALTDLPY